MTLTEDDHSFTVSDMMLTVEIDVHEMMVYRVTPGEPACLVTWAERPPELGAVDEWLRMQGYERLGSYRLFRSLDGLALVADLQPSSSQSASTSSSGKV
jgi:hypothetical protein